MAIKSTLIALLVIVFVCGEVHSQQNANADEQDPRRFLTKRSVRVCGIKLVDMMKKVCNHCYKTRKNDQTAHGVGKRDAAQSGSKSIAVILEDEPVSSDEQLQAEDDHSLHEVRRGLDALDSYINKRWGSSDRPTRHQSGGGIANKCCLNQCSYSDLTSYCCTPPGSS